MSHDVRANLDDLLNGLLTGRLLEVFEKHYHADVVMSENGKDDPERHGKDKNRAYEAYFAEHATWHGANVTDILVDGDRSAYVMFCDFTFHGQRLTFTQSAVQRWKDGQIIQETFFYSR